MGHKTNKNKTTYGTQDDTWDSSQTHNNTRFDKVSLIAGKSNCGSWLAATTKDLNRPYLIYRSFPTWYALITDSGREKIL